MNATPQPQGGCTFLEGGVVVCRPRYFSFHSVTDCPTCERKRRMVTRWEMWHGLTTYCLSCGERWEDGERSERPFRRGWREESKRYARTLSAHALTRPAFRAAVTAYEDDYFSRSA